MRSAAQLAEKLPMRQEFTASLAIKSPQGMGFGTAYWMQGDRIAFTTELELEKGDRIEIRMELTGFNDSAMGEILLLQTREEQGGMITCLGQIMEMPQGDFEMLNQWLENLVAGNTASQSSRWLASLTNSRGPQARQEETNAALRRMDKRMGHEGTPSRAPSVVPIEGKSGPDSSVRKRVGRQAIRAALRASVQAGGKSGTSTPKAESVPESPTSSPPPAPSDEAAARAPAQNTPTPLRRDNLPDLEPRTAAASPGVPSSPGGDNTVHVGIRASRGADDTVQISWANTQSLIHTWKQGLKGGKLTLPYFENAPEAGESCRFSFNLPDGETFVLRGRVTQSDNSGLLCSIRIPWGTRIKLLRIQEQN